MNRVLTILVTILAIVFGRSYVVELLYGPVGGSSAPGQSAMALLGDAADLRHVSPIVATFAPLLQSVGADRLAPHELQLLSIGVLAYAAVLGRLSRAYLGDVGFGAFFSSLLVLLGAQGALVGFGHFAPDFARGHLDVLGAAVLASSLLCLALGAMVKSLIVSHTWAFLRGEPARVSGAVASAERRRAFYVKQS